jgi:outer membrane cobalamin receptor
MARIDTGTPPAGQLAVPPIADAYAQTAAYLQSQWFSKNGGEFYAGLRGEHDLNSQANSQGGALSPSIGGIVPLTPSLQLKVNAATAFRAPTAEELFYPPQGVYSNDALVPERTRVGDATFAGKTGIGDVSAGWFTTSGSNMIVDANPALYNYEPVNIGRASIQGVLVALTTHAYHRIVTTVSITDLYRAEDLETQTRIAGRGPVIASSFGFRYVSIPNSHFDGAGVTIVSNGSVQPADYTQPYYAQASAFTRVDAYTSYRVAPKLVVSLRGFNLLDDRYAVYNGFPMPGRSFALELRTR